MTEARITAVRARAVTAPLARPIRTAAGEIPAAPLVLIDVETEAGVTGHAYLFAYTPMTLRALVAFIQDFAPQLEGQAAAPVDVFALAERTFRLLGKQGLVGMAVSGIDMALWDALGKRQGVPVATLLGAEPRPVQAYDSYGTVDPADADDVKMLEAAVERGFKGLKIKLGTGDRAADVACVRGVRDIVGPDVALMVDYNQTLTVPDALERIDALAEFDVAWIEEPVPAEDLAGHARIREKSPLPIQTGENWWFADGMAHAVEMGASDLAMLDIMKIGGVTGWMRAAGQAEAASLPVSSHLFVEASSHTLAATPTAHWLEYLDVASAVLQEPAGLVDGCVTARGPGLGIDWDEDAIARLT